MHKMSHKHEILSKIVKYDSEDERFRNTTEVLSDHVTCLLLQVIYFKAIKTC